MSSSAVPVSRRGTWKWLFAVVFLLFLCVIVAVILLLSRKPGEVLLAGIDQPQNGEMVDVNQPVPVTAWGIYTKGVSRVELYADGALVDVQETTLPNGSNPLTLINEWIPQTPGRHILIARAYSLDKNMSDSPVVAVDVNPAPETNTVPLVSLRDPASGTCPSLTQVSMSSGIPVMRLQELNPALASADVNAPLACDVSLTVPATPPGGRSAGGTPPGGSSSGGPSGGTPAGDGSSGGRTGTPPVPLAGTPAAPSSLNGSLTCSDANLTWSASADATNGYALYVLRPGGSFFVRIPVSGSGTSARVPIIGYGTFRFQVASLRNGMEGLSAVISLDSPGTCVPPAVAGTSQVTLSFISLDTSEHFDGVYCYVHVMDAPGMRVPEAAFSYMHPEADGLTYAIQRQLPNHGLFSLSVPDNGLVTLNMECWGARGAESISLGSFSASHARGEWDGRDLVQTAWVPSTREVASLNGIGAKNGGYNFRIRYRIDSSDPVNLERLFDPHLFPHPPIILPPFRGAELTLPPPTNLRRGEVFNSIFRHDTGNEDGSVTSVESSIYGEGLRWDWAGNAQYNESNVIGYSVQIMSQDILNGGRPRIIWTNIVRPPAQKSVLLPQIPDISSCGFRITYLVRVISYLGSGASPDATLVVDNPPCQNVARIHVTFQSLELDSIDDRGDFCILCGPDRTLEIFGGFSVNNQAAYLINGSDPNNCIVPLTAGTYDLAGMNMSKGNILDYSTMCNDSGHYERQSSGIRANDIQQIITSPLQTFAVYTMLNDDDPAIFGIPDSVIYSTTQFARRDMVSWQRLDQTVMIRQLVHSGPGDGDQGINQGVAVITFRVHGEPYGSR